MRKQTLLLMSLVLIVLTLNLTSAFNEWNISESNINLTGEFSVITEETTAEGLVFSPDGLNMYIAGTDNKRIFRYSLSSPYNVSSSVVVSNMSVVDLGYTSVQNKGIYITEDGHNIYMISSSSPDNVYQIVLEDAWDITSYNDSAIFRIYNYEAQAKDVFLTPDGTKMFITGVVANNVTTFDLSTPYNISTATLNQSVSFTGIGGGWMGFFFSSNGLRMYMIDLTDSVFQFDLGVAWDVSTYSYVQETIYSSYFTRGSDVFFTPEGDVMMLLSDTNDKIFLFDVGETDTTNPNATLLTPANGTNYTTTAHNFTASLTDDTALANATLYIYNSGGSLVNETTFSSLSGTSTTVGEVFNLSVDDYEWFVTVYDSSGNSYTTGNFTVSIEEVPLICTVLSSGNYTITDGVLYADASSPYLYSSVNISYDYSNSQSSYAGEVIDDTATSIAGVTEWFEIIIVITAMIVLILLTIIIINTIRGSGMMGSA